MAVRSPSTRRARAKIAPAPVADTAVAAEVVATAAENAAVAVVAVAVEAVANTAANRRIGFHRSRSPLEWKNCSAESKDFRAFSCSNFARLLQTAARVVRGA